MNKKIIAGLVAAVIVGVVNDYNKYVSSAVPILIYHGIGEGCYEDWGDMLIPTELFRGQLEYLSVHGWKVSSLRDIGTAIDEGDVGGKRVAFTFDDGYINNYENAFPALQEYRATATFYVIPSMIGVDGYMTQEQLRTMAAAKMDIASHTLSHCKLTDLSREELERELIQSKRELDKLLGQNTNGISYPNGAYDERVIEATARAGYTLGVTGDPGVNTPQDFKDKPFTLRRIGVFDRTATPEQLEKNLRQARIVGYLHHCGIDTDSLFALWRWIKHRDM